MEIKEKIKNAFGDVPFPYHCGWKAAIACDDWISDPVELEKITKQDVKGKWWEIPYEEMYHCSLAQCYLDAKGTEFYLPAYMFAIIDNNPHCNCSSLTSWLMPMENTEECNLYDYFCDQFLNFDKVKKLTCVDALKFIRDNLDPRDNYSRKDIDKVLNHEFWKI